MPNSASEGNLFQVLFNAVPLPLFRVDREVEILDLNHAARRLFNNSSAQPLRKRGGDLMHCLNAGGGCGNAPPCTDCLIRNSVRQVFTSGHEIARRRATVEIRVDEKTTELDLLLTVTPIFFAGEASVLLCLEDISELASLRALIPICSNCKKIRDDHQFWNSLESYFARYHGLDFTHGICPDCSRRLYPEFYRKGKD